MSTPSLDQNLSVLYIRIHVYIDLYILSHASQAGSPSKAAQQTTAATPAEKTLEIAKAFRADIIAVAHVSFEEDPTGLALGNILS